MKVGIYLEHLYTAGGGERHTGSIAEFISKYHDVELITKTKVELSEVESKLDLDLSRTKVVYWPEADDDYLDRLTSQYDIFINSSIFSSVKNQSNFGIAKLFFPIVLNYNYPILLKRIILFLTSLIFAKRHNSFHLIGKRRPEIKSDWRISDQEIGIIPEKNFKGLKLTFTEYNKTLSELINKVTINSQSIKFEIKKNIVLIKSSINKNDLIKLEFNSKNLLLKKQNEQEYYLEEPYCFRILYIEFLTTSFLINFVNLLLKFKLTKKITAKIYGIYVKQKSSFRSMGYLKTYKLIWSNSKYTQGWIKKIYNLDSQIVYPPIDIDKFHPGEKENIILSVGRFFPRLYGHNKKQLEMIKFFKKAYDENKEFKNYEYHLCGGMKDSKPDIEYVEECKREAKGYPIFIHPNIPFKDLQQMYAKSKIFWHAAGFGEDPRSPDLFEHFGMTTVESMSAGAVPVVVNAGGQPEIIKDGENGYTWNNPEELIEKSLKIINNEDLREALSSKAIETSKKYSKAEMNKTLKRILSKYNLINT